MSRESKAMAKVKLIAILQQIKSLTEDCIRAVDSRGSKQRVVKSRSGQHTSPLPIDVDFGKPLRPFIKTYGKGLSGPKKFTLLLSWLAGGDANKQIALSEIQKKWKRMTAKSLLGMGFNPFFPAAARDNDWLESKKQGVYNLRPDWRNALKRKG